jgi:hypothetical protein
LGLSHQQLPYFYFTFKRFTKAHNYYSSALSSALLPICSMLDIFIMSLPKTNSLGDFVVVFK